jgi:hypothetical protein
MEHSFCSLGSKLVGVVPDLLLEDTLVGCETNFIERLRADLIILLLLMLQICSIVLPKGFL